MERLNDRIIEVTTTAPTEELAQRIATALVEKRLAACVQVSGPLTSTYRWQGKIETASEYRCVAKTSAAAYQRLASAILELHPYDVPEILAVPICNGISAYLDWVGQEIT